MKAARAGSEQMAIADRGGRSAVDGNGRAVRQRHPPADDLGDRHLDATVLGLDVLDGGSTCVQVAFLGRGLVAIRDSKNPQLTPHLFTDAEYDAFVAGIEQGELRRPAT